MRAFWTAGCSSSSTSMGVESRCCDNVVEEGALSKFQQEEAHVTTAAVASNVSGSNVLNIIIFPLVVIVRVDRASAISK